ncbi:Mn2+ and Fe2+ transporter of the NRAMP family [Heterobasidion irregulare TC 32-1]|uniref:Mn2+ and Fe2+ transporter of the NRAMP family n=1 Tax=Heterobasidion irregulare (strain TC 32-1) TaxID=747525 RepID=W4KP24_HETIT|nr:Mn2+ and Fe2+ transporter of the NRAMP family [Heterobasidion irregulare TC 32-1]ETW87567.1 Mn2+ and Fe2+ transporter of the NRAMP family [Heterobasidion irregulare TC 32-1]
MPPPLALQTHDHPPTSSREVERHLRRPHRLVTTYQTAFHHVKKHAGVGIVCAVAYFDPGNWSVDMQAGSSFGYRPMLFVILMAGLGAVVLQTMAAKLGCVTGADLASHCRLLLYNRPKHRLLIRYGVLYPLYVLCEIAIISTDLAELLGSAIGLVLLFPKLPLWSAVLLTATDVLVFLIIGDPTRGHGRPVRMFEFSVIILVAAVFVCFLILLAKIGADWPHVFLGFVPSKKLFESKPNAIYTAVGILGATVMPHAIFLGSFLATQDRVRPDNNSLEFIQAHLGHGIVDMVMSLLGVAVPINSAILVIAATVFFQDGDPDDAPAGLFDAHDLIRDHIGKAAASMFALALLCAGQTASITATLAGQIVSEGFIEWRISPFLRRLITRLIGLIPSMVVAIAVGREGIDTLLIASQVTLSIVLPFVVLPLVWLTSSSAVMTVNKPTPSPTQEKHVDDKQENIAISEIRQSVDYSNGLPLKGLGYAIWLVIVVANAYVLVVLVMGSGV